MIFVAEERERERESDNNCKCFTFLSKSVRKDYIELNYMRILHNKYRHVLKIALNKMTLKYILKLKLKYILNVY